MLKICKKDTKLYIYDRIATVFWGIKTQGENTNIKWLQ